MPSPIFIVGYMHSGTTLLFRILGRHPALQKSGGETKFFEFLPEIARRFPDLDDRETRRNFLRFAAHTIQSGYHARQRIAEKIHPAPDGPAIELASSVEHAVRDQSRTHGELFAATFDALAESRGKLSWVEKTPTHIFNIDEIARAIPSARFLEIVRDPRDVLASKKTRSSTVWTSDRYTEEQRAYKHLEKSFDIVWDTLSWKSAIRAGWEARSKRNVTIHTIRYEDLVLSPASTVKQLCAAMDLPFEPEMLDVHHRNAADPDRDGSAGIATDSVSRWKGVLSPGEMATCQTFAAAEMTAYDYEMEPVSVGQKLGVGLHLGRASLRLADRLYQRWQMGGTRFLGTVLAGYTRRARTLLISLYRQ